MPLIHGSSTPRANVVATTASMQSPPAASTLAPTSAALRDCAATIPPLETTAALRICWLLLNWSCTVWPSSLGFVGERLPIGSIKTSGAPRAMPLAPFAQHDSLPEADAQHASTPAKWRR